MVRDTLLDTVDDFCEQRATPGAGLNVIALWLGEYFQIDFRAFPAPSRPPRSHPGPPQEQIRNSDVYKHRKSQPDVSHVSTPGKDDG